MIQKKIEHFFETARERELIRLRKEGGLCHFPYTNDKIFQEWRFCNVHRENDKTTIWFRENLRDRLNGWRLVRATFIFRWFNRIETAEKINDLLHGGWDSEEAHDRLEGVKPLVTGAYIVHTPYGMNKLDGILWSIEDSLPELKLMSDSWGSSLKSAWKDICGLTQQGPFTSYEIVTDLRHTPILENANDIMTWASAGPGCTRGLSRIVGRELDMYRDRDEMSVLMQELLECSKTYWPSNYQSWEMREVEHWLCEYHKYMNAGEGKRLKRRYKA